jgi:hypothetical protein
MSKFPISITAVAAILGLVTLFLTCCSSSKKITIPVNTKVSFEDTYTIIWNGYSKAFIYKDENWQRAETFDYYFDVIQKRYDKEWKSVKSLHRIHPEYNGKAGQRDQTMYFGLKYNSIQNGKVNGLVHSSLGDGIINTDNEYRNAVIDLNIKDVSMFMPYNKIKITQFYDYEKGKLTETVLLFKVKDGIEIPFMKNEEEAYFYLKGKLDKVPTKFEKTD